MLGEFRASIGALSGKEASFIDAWAWNGRSTRPASIASPMINNRGEVGRRLGEVARGSPMHGRHMGARLQVGLSRGQRIRVLKNRLTMAQDGRGLEGGGGDQ